MMGILSYHISHLRLERERKINGRDNSNQMSSLGCCGANLQGTDKNIIEQQA